jgi:hypothetical protein
LLVAGCSSHAASSNGGDAAAGASGADALPQTDADPSTAQGFCRGFLDLVAQTFTRCDGVPMDYARTIFSSDSPCQRFLGNIAAHRIRFDGTHGASCLRAIGATVAACGGASVSMQEVTECGGVLTPLVPLGGTCTSFYVVGLGEQCLGDGVYCKEGPGYACTGVCTARLPIGSPCDQSSSADDRCIKSASCDSKTKTCVPTPAAPGEGDTCGAPNEPSCAKGFYCDRTVPDAGVGMGVCRARKTSGGCSLDSDCATGLRCIGTPTMCTTPRAVGQACTPGARECDLWSHCSADGKCTSAGAAIGQPCGTVGGELVPCAQGGYCDVAALAGTAGTCQALKHDGDACTGATLVFECGGDNGNCNATTHTCASCAP